MTFYSKFLLFSRIIPITKCVPQPLIGAVSNRITTISTHQPKISQINIQSCRCINFFTSYDADRVWSAVTGVSSVGRKRGRAKRVGRMRQTDLNRGQRIGDGRKNVQWPGLNSPILKGREVFKRTQGEPDPDYQTKLAKIRETMARVKQPPLAPLLRGWSGKRFPGQNVGEPDPMFDYKFDGFNSRVLEFKLVCNMTGTLGRKSRFSALVAVGNSNGCAGFALAKSQNGKTAIRVAKNRAAQRLHYYQLFDDHTVFHNMHEKYRRTKLFIHKQESGYGLRCHRAVKAICELIGIKDLHCKVEGNTKNVQSITKGFFEALDKMENHQTLADRTGYHVVELREECQNYPRVLASPSIEKLATKPLLDENNYLDFDFNMFYYGGKVEYFRPGIKLGLAANPDSKKARQMHKLRNQQHLAYQRLAGII